MDSVPKDQNKNQDKENKEYVRCFKLIQSLHVISSYIFDFAGFCTIFFPKYELVYQTEEQKLAETETEQIAVETQGKKKGKKNKKK